HERLRTRDRDAHAVDRAFGDARVGRLEGELGARTFCEARRDLKADVVPRGGITFAGITEPDDDAVDTRRRMSASEKLRESRQLCSQTPKRPVHTDGASNAYLFQVNDSVRDLARGALVDRVQHKDGLIGSGLARRTEMRREVLRRYRRDGGRTAGGAE